ncbi:MAG TPA: thioredoxin domain-containing protein [Gammaproteobacteria bacterium]
MNALANETSPYLLQHADNPVQWYAWNEEALALARSADKPILLSIGYSACHWCHVMAHESFEDERTAELMNALYVNIKVDREERPDLDKIYQTAHQLLTGRPGGWPLTVFLTPDEHLPIFTGTYFPKEPRYGMPAFRDVLIAIERHYREHRDEIAQQGAALVRTLRDIDAGSADDFAALDAAPLRTARARLEQTFDAEFGGFGGAPKFPHATGLELLLERSQGGPDGKRDERALAMVERTLERMALGGLYDQLGGGFFRYSVDRRWAIPHFEKMLYDNAALLTVYADAFAATGNELYRRIAAETAEWVLRDMRHPGGAFYSTLDADSEGEEGRFYLWTPAEIDAALDADEARVAKRAFGLERPANFEERAWHLHLVQPPADAADAELLERARRKLLAVRERRVWPGRDDKILVSWNGLMIRALARAARRLERPDLAAAAERALDFIRAELWRDGRLRATYKDGRARFAAYLDDYAFLAAGVLELAQCRWRDGDLAFACELVDVLLSHFEDPAGGFFFTANDHERLIHKPKPFADESVPAGNAVAALALLELGHVLGEERYLAAAERVLRAGLHALTRYPDAHATLLRVLDRLLEPPQVVVLRGDDRALAEWGRVLERGYHPRRLAFRIPADAGELPKLLGERKARDGGAVAYVCEGTTCHAPVTSLPELEQALAP